ncbi:MAG: UDP-N-acetylmuramate dehydrogenase [Patescibacteria group bacterium]|nr:UDP-N-acetylmuramate dehydrogenase [Patescibacteria group bacterium]MDE2438139.1 UDP-N-acetylmuramate dehydrogenase [Patescibacteria group bacterium]
MKTRTDTIENALHTLFKKRLRIEYPLREITSIHIGGPAHYIVMAQHEHELLEAVRLARAYRMPYVVIGEASNIIAEDIGFNGLVIQNRIADCTIDKSTHSITVGAGYNLLALIKRINAIGLAGMERMAGIPGTIGGAIYGCAGAYGQEIKDCLHHVQIYDGRTVRWLTRDACMFRYRSSIFKKKKNWIILAATFTYTHAHPAALKKISRDTIRLREKKYPRGMRCPGSFFKNLVIKMISPASLRDEFMKKIPPEKITFGKLASGYLLEEAGAMGLAEHDIAVAAYHGNLIYNKGNGTAHDLARLVKRLKHRVQKKFGIELSEEVQYI